MSLCKSEAGKERGPHLLPGKAIVEREGEERRPTVVGGENGRGKRPKRALLFLNIPPLVSTSPLPRNNSDNQAGTEPQSRAHDAIVCYTFFSSVSKALGIIFPLTVMATYMYY